MSEQHHSSDEASQVETASLDDADLENVAGGVWNPGLKDPNISRPGDGKDRMRIAINGA